MIVPHRDLVGQFWHWIHKTANAPTVRTPLRMPSICQILVRDEASPLISRISALRDEPPHILIGTPQALMDIWNEDRDALQLESLSAVVVDEVDYLIESVPRKPSRIMMERARRKIDRHPSATRQLLDIIYGPRVKAGSNDRNELGAKKHTMPRLPQLIMSSATLRNHLKIYLFNESGWLRKERLQKVVGLPTFLQQNLRRRGTEVRGDIAAEADWESRPEAVNEKRDGVGRIRISHFVLVVSGNGDTKNIDGATRREDVDNAADVVVKEDRKAITPETVFEAQEAQTGPAIDNKLEESGYDSSNYNTRGLTVQYYFFIVEFGNTPAPFDLNGFEAIATAFALDVPSIALLVLPASAPVQRVIYELRKMGVDAHGVDLYGKGRERLLYGGGEVRSAKENPILLVSTLATTRGLDFPELSHVFILGVPEGGKIDGRSMDSYLHIAGRVGRFGRNGKVITVVEDADDLEGMKVILKELRIKPSRFEYFD